MRLLLCTPAFNGNLTVPYVTSLLNSYTHLITKGTVNDIQFHFLSTESLISRARNKCAQAALDGNFDYLMFIDADMAWRAEDLDLILRSGKEIVGGTYPIKSLPITLNLNPLPGQTDEFGEKRDMNAFLQYRYKYADGATKLIEVAHIPTGFMCINVNVFRALVTRGKVEPYVTFQPDTGELKEYHDFFPVRVVKGRYESEDWAFCSIARSAGFKVYLHGNVICGHLGNHLYRAD